MVDCCILVYYITDLPLNLSTINMMLGGGRLGSSGFVFMLISVRFVDREVIPPGLEISKGGVSNTYK